MAGPGNFLTRPWDGQPQYGIEIAREWRDLVAFASVSGVPSGRGDIVSGKQPSIFGTINSQATKYGLASKPSAAASTRYEYATRPVSSVTDGYSILTVAAPVSSGSAVKRMVVLGNEAASAFTGVTLAFNLSKTGTATAGYACLIEYNSAFLASCDADGVADGAHHVYVAVRSPGNVAPALFVDGALRTFSSTSSASTFTPAIITSLHGSPGASSAQGAPEESLLTVIFNRPLTGQQVSALGRIDGLWGTLFAPRRIFVPVAAAGGGATATLTGVGVTSAAGSLSATGAAATTLTGASSTASAGTVSASASTNASTTVVGAGTTASAGTLTATGAAAKTLTGATSTASAGAVAATGSATKALTGVGTTASAGTVSATAGGSATATISGVSAASAAGTVTATGAATKTLTGAGTTASAGTVTASSGTNAAVTLTGCAVSASVGALSASGSAQIVIVGAAVTASAGRVSVVEAATPRQKIFLPPIPLPKNTLTAYDRELQQAIKGWADNATRLINDLASRIP